MTDPDTSTGRHHLRVDQPDQTDAGSGDTPAFPPPDLAGDLPMLRVLWLLCQGMNLPWCLRDLCDQEAVERAITANLVVPPDGDLIAFHLTDAGRAHIRDWYLAIREHRHEPGNTHIWHAVTRR